MPSPTTPIPAADVPIWAAYGQKVLNAFTAGQALGTDQVVFICAPTAMPVPAGPWTLPSIENDFVHQIGDSLLDVNSPLYNPFAKASYIQWLNKYLGFADPDPTITSTLNPAKVKYLVSLAGSADAAYATLQTDTTNAVNAWTAANAQSIEIGDPTVSYNTWLQSNPTDPVVAAQTAYNTALGKFEQEYLTTYGDAGSQLLGYRNNLLMATDQALNHPGYNMSCCDDDVANAFDAWAKDHNAVPPPDTSVFNAPDYKAQGMTQAAQNWAEDYVNGNRQNVSWTLDILSEQESSFLSLGHDQAQTSSGNQDWIFYSQTTSSGSTTSTKNLDFTKASEELKLTLNFVGLQTFSVQPGQWDVPDVQGLYTLTPGHSVVPLNNVVKISSILVGYGMGLTAQFLKTASTQASTMYSNLTNKSTSDTEICGIHIGTSSSSSNSNVVDTSSVTFDSSTSTMTIPQLNTGVPILLGLLGTKITSPTNPPQGGGNSLQSAPNGTTVS